MKYHIFVAGDCGVEHQILNSKTELKNRLKELDEYDIISIIKGGKTLRI